jgi:hypothetical protein
VEFVFERDPGVDSLVATVAGDPVLAPIALPLLEAGNVPEISLVTLADVIERLERAEKKARSQALLREIGERGVSETDDPRTLEYRKLERELAQDAKGDE